MDITGNSHKRMITTTNAVINAQNKKKSLDS